MDAEDAKFVAMIDADVREAEARLEKLRAVQSYVHEKMRVKGHPRSNGESLPAANGPTVKVASHLLDDRTRFEACEIILKAAGRPMRTIEIVRSMKESGYNSDVEDNALAAAIFTAMHRKDETFRKTGRGVWGLKSWDS